MRRTISDTDPSSDVFMLNAFVTMYGYAVPCRLPCSMDISHSGAAAVKIDTNRNMNLRVYDGTYMTVMSSVALTSVLVNPDIFHHVFVW